MKTIREIVALLRSIDHSLKVLVGSMDKHLIDSTSGRRQIEEGIRNASRVRQAGGRR